VEKIALNKWVRYWMILGLVLIFFQVVIGGITRLTGSGLSITKWEIVTGSIPPLTERGWHEAFQLYKETPQYQKLNQGMQLTEFKWIYFWEYLHRLWARVMGLIFIIPFAFFLMRRWLSAMLVKRLTITFVLAGLVGLFGWIMVASGLVDRPWVNAYKLTVHLCLALLVFGYLEMTVLKASYDVSKTAQSRSFGIFRVFTGLLLLQIFVGGLMSGMKASLVYPTFPDFQGEWIPGVLRSSESWVVENIVNYDTSPFMSALVQVIHRGIAYCLIISGLYIYWNRFRGIKERFLARISTLWITLLVLQICLGIAVLIGSTGVIPVIPGVLHQAVAMLLLAASLAIYYFLRGGGSEEKLQ